MCKFISMQPFFSNLYHANTRTFNTSNCCTCTSEDNHIVWIRPGGAQPDVGVPISLQHIGAGK